MAPWSKEIVQCFGVIDEADIIEKFLAYHLSIGVDAFVAVDVGSTDGTLDILSQHERAGHLHLFRANGEWNWPVVKMAKEQFNAGWCLFGDADEFWMFPGGDAHAYLRAAQSEIIIFPRYNVLPVKDDISGSIAHFSNFDLIVHNPIQFFYHQPENVLQNLRVRRENREYALMLLSSFSPEILRVIGPKVIARPELVQSLAPGWHDVISVRADPSRHYERTGYIAHFPMRSVEQLRRKAALIAKLFDQVHTDDLDRSFHWARLSVLFQHNLIEQEFFRQVLSETEVDRLLSEDVLRRDLSLPRVLGGVSGSLKAPPSPVRVQGQTGHLLTRL